jgi:myosin heavy subunit
VRLPLYGEDTIRKYKNRRQGEIMPPHVYDIAHDSFYRMTSFQKLQSIVISGESGAGKTECTKQALQYLAAIAGSTNNVEQKILSANPVLEAFGNAKTLRNDNSSRFGKYMEIFFDHNNRISGCATENYLLEKIRVVMPGEGERNFHIFYQLCVAAPPALRKRLHLKTDPGKYDYLKTCVDVDGMDDEKEFKDVMAAFEALDFADEERDGMYDMVAAILALGNVKFREARPDESEVVRDAAGQWLESAASLLRIAPDVLGDALVHREVRVRGQEKTMANLDLTGAVDNRNALCKFVYGAMFDWLVQRINKSMKKGSGGGGSKSSSSGLYIGILDIFGFEIFKHNSFEQLCINYTNEMLQQHFNNNTFKLEEEIYNTEGITWEAIDFIDNEPMIDLITKRRVGILPLLDEELKLLGRGNDKSFLSKLFDKQSSNPVMVKSVKAARGTFTVRHFAGKVTYTVEGFLEKNRDTLTEDLVDMLRGSEHPFLQILYPADSAVSTGQRKASLSKQFQRQLKDLMGQLYATEPHYIRCIKPNDTKSALRFIPRNCYEQLTYSGVFEAVAIRKKGFPFRLKHEAFVDRYAKLCKGDTSGGSAKAQCKAIAKAMGLDLKNIQVGRTMVLYRAMEYRTLELKWSVVTKHETITQRVKDLLKVSTGGMSKQDKDDFCQDLAYAVREASLFRITGADITRAKTMLDKFIEERIDPETKRMLAEALRTKDLAKLRAVIDRCEHRGIEGSKVFECRALISQVEDAEAALAFALKSMQEAHLDKALQMCDAFEYISDSVERARDLLKKVIKAAKGVKQALKRAPKFKASMIEKVVKFCRGFGYDTEKFHTLEALNTKIKAARKHLNAAYDAVDEGLLQQAVDECKLRKFNGSHYEATLVQDCQDLLDRIRVILEEAAKAKKQCIEEQVEAVVSAARRIGLKADVTRGLAKLVDGPREKFLAQQIKCAIKVKDTDRAARAQIKLHDIECKDGPAPTAFEGLRDKTEWAGGNAKKAAKMGSWEKPIAHSPFMKNFKSMRADAKKDYVKRFKACFETVQKCMAQRHTSRIPQRLEELALNCSSNPALVDEVYFSIVKQCTQNVAVLPDAKPSLASTQPNCLLRAVKLTAYLLTIVPPSKAFVPHLAYYFRCEPFASLGATYNLKGLLARISITGAVAPSEIPRRERTFVCGCLFHISSRCVRCLRHN